MGAKAESNQQERQARTGKRASVSGGVHC
jgi:hypothetical protein